jgi:putative endonuclease
MRLHPRKPTQWDALYRRDQQLVLRIHQHRSNAVAGFVQDYGVHRLVFAEFHETMEAAILREKRLKKWRRAWKLELIERHNPQWRDLYDELAV